MAVAEPPVVRASPAAGGEHEGQEADRQLQRSSALASG
jgi:hypothetical protein